VPKTSSNVAVNFTSRSPDERLLNDFGYSMDPQIPELAATFHLLAPDLPG
jgi:hypothetical protein